MPDCEKCGIEALCSIFELFSFWFQGHIDDFQAPCSFVLFAWGVNPKPKAKGGET